MNKPKRFFYDNAHVKVGDVFYCSWGYEQTNIDYYKVIDKIGKGSVKIAPVENKIVHEQSSKTTDAVVPYLAGDLSGRGFTARVKYVCWDDFKQPRIKLSSYQSLFLWDGVPKHQTNAWYGH